MNQTTPILGNGTGLPSRKSRLQPQPIYIRVNDAPLYFALSRSTIYRAAERGELEIHKRGAASLLKVEEVEDWIRWKNSMHVSTPLKLLFRERERTATLIETARKNAADADTVRKYKARLEELDRAISWLQVAPNHKIHEGIQP